MSIKSIPPPTTCMNWCCDIDECIIVNRGGKLVFSTDGAHTKPQSGFKGQLLNMSGVDSNGNVVSLAYALVRQEDKDEYVWFLSTLKRIVLEDGSVFSSVLDSSMCVIFSDRQKGLAAAIRAECPRSHHLPCCHHLMVHLE